MKIGKPCVACGLELASWFGRCQTCWRRKATTEMKRAFQAGLDSDQASVEPYRRGQVSFGKSRRENIGVSFNVPASEFSMYFGPGQPITEGQAKQLQLLWAQRALAMQRLMAILEAAILLADPDVNTTPRGKHDPAFFEEMLIFITRALQQADGDRYTRGWPAPKKAEWLMTLQWWMFN